MSPTGHKFTGAALALALGYSFYESGNALPAALVAGGAMLGARAPDWMEVARWEKGRRYSIIPHRGPTHWPFFWVLLLVIALVWEGPLLSAALLGFAASGLLHLVLDVMTPSGIPLWSPFARKKLSFRIYRAGDVLPEIGLTLLVWGLSLSYIFMFKRPVGFFTSFLV